MDAQTDIAITIRCRIEHGKIFCDFKATNWPDGSIDDAKRLINEAIETHRKKAGKQAPPAAGPPGTVARQVAQKAKSKFLPKRKGR